MISAQPRKYVYSCCYHNYSNQLIKGNYQPLVECMQNYDFGQDLPFSQGETYLAADKLFPKRETIVPRWVPRIDWEGVSYDPSGRAQKVHNAAL